MSLVEGKMCGREGPSEEDEVDDCCLARAKSFASNILCGGSECVKCI